MNGVKKFGPDLAEYYRLKASTKALLESGWTADDIHAITPKCFNFALFGYLLIDVLD